jgi:hypothetical protein
MLKNLICKYITSKNLYLYRCLKFCLNLTSNTSKDLLIQDYTVLSFYLVMIFLDKQLCINIKEHGVDIITKAYIKAYKVS